MNREPAKSGDEQDWVSGWRRVLCVFRNHTGLGKAVKRAMNKRARRRARATMLRERANRSDEAAVAFSATAETATCKESLTVQRKESQ